MIMLLVQSLPALLLDEETSKLLIGRVCLALCTSMR